MKPPVHSCRTTTMWEEFMSFRQKSNQHISHELVRKQIVEYVLYASGIQYVIFQEPALEALYIPTTMVKGLMTLCLGLMAYITYSKKWADCFSLPLTVVLCLFTTLHSLDSMLAEISLSQTEMEAIDDVGKIFASRTLGAHHVLFMLVILMNVKILVQKPSHHVCVLAAALISSYCPVVILQYLRSARCVDSTFDFVRGMMAMLITGAGNAYGSHLWLKSEWITFIQRKRLQFACIRSEELLTLAMPRDIAHELMVGSIKTRYHEDMSVAFLYISNYEDELLKSESTFAFVNEVHHLYCQLDELVLSHPHVYKVESVGGCYMVASGIPNYRPQHGQALLSFCIEALELCHAFKNANPWRVVEYRKLKQMSIQPWQLKVGIHSGSATTGCCGKTRTFYRVFGDSVNTASRLASKAPPGYIYSSESFFNTSLKSPPLGQVFQPKKCATPMIPLTSNNILLKGKGRCKCYVLAPGSELPLDASISARKRYNSSLNNAQYSELHASYENAEDSLATHETLWRELHCERLGYAQTIIGRTSKLLNVSLSDAVHEYKDRNSDVLPNFSDYYISRLEDSYMDLFVSKFVSHDYDGIKDEDTTEAHSKEKWFERNTIDYIFHQPDEYSFPSWPRIKKTLSPILTFSCGWILGASFSSRYIPSLKTVVSDFADPHLEKIFQQGVEMAVYKIAMGTTEWLLFILVLAAGLYSYWLKEHTWFPTIVCVCIGGLTVFVQQFQNSKDFYKAKVLSELFPIKSILTFRTSKEDDSASGNPQAEMSNQEAERTSFTDLAQSILRLSPWMFAFAWITILVVSGFDHAALMYLELPCSHGELCLHGLIVPMTVLSLFQSFYPTMASQFILQIVSMILVSFVYSLSGVFNGCPPLLFGVEVFALFSTVHNGIVQSCLQEMNFRQSFILQCAATHAKFQSDIALEHLFPETIVTKLQDSLEVPFVEHTGDLVILRSDLVGCRFTEISARLSSKLVRLLLDNLFSQFDDIVSAEKLWKMDTVGDAYVVVGGLVEPASKEHLVDRFIHVAQKMVNIVEQFKVFTRHNVGIRVSIHVGPATTGVVGRLRPRFYAFGKTMEESVKLEYTGKTNQIHISQKAAELYRQNQFVLKRRDINEEGISFPTYFVESAS